MSGLIQAAWAWIVEAATTPGLGSVLFAVMFVQLWIGLAAGRFGRARTTTWLLLIVVPVAIGALSVVGYVLPWGQAKVALAAWSDRLPFGRETARRLLATLFDHGPYDVGTAIGWAVLLADMVVAYLGAWRGRGVGGVLWRMAAIVAFAVFADVLAVLALAPPAAPDSPLTPMQIVPPWYDLPLYAVLRCVPDKLTSLTLAVAAALVPAFWALIGRARRTTLFWPLWLGIAAVWVGLGALGGRMPDDPTVTATQALAACWFAFFLLGPILLRRVRPGGRAERSG